MGKASNNSMGW